MDQTKQLIQEFNTSKVGQVLNGSEAFRNRVGCWLHGLTHKHPRLAMLGSAALFAGGAATVGPLAASPAVFPASYSAAVSFTPKGRIQERASCEFLMNVGVRKAAAFSKFLDEKGITGAAKEAAVSRYLEAQAPKFGYFKDYMRQFPNAVQQIMNSEINGKKTGDLPLIHNKEVYHLEAVQEALTKGRNKGGILHGLMRSLSPETRAMERQAGELAAQRWADRQAWEALPPESREPWRRFSKAREFERSVAAKRAQDPTITRMNADFEQRRVAPQAAIDKAKGGYDSPSRPVLPDNPMGAKSVDKTQSSHHDAKGRMMSETTTVGTVSRQGDKLNLNTIEATDYYDKKGRTTQRNTSSTHTQGSVDGVTPIAKTDSVSRPNGMTWSRTVDSQNGMTTFREANGTTHTEWTFNREGQLVSTLSCSPEKTSEVRYQVDAQGRLVGATEKTTLVTPDGEQVSQVQRKASEINIPKPSTPTDTPPSRLSPEAKSAFKSIGNFAGRAGIIWLAGKYGEATRDTGPIPESNGGRLIGQYSDELTKSKQKAFAYLGAAGMATAATGIALTAGGKAIAKVVGKNAAKMGVKAVPVIGTVIGLGMAANRAVHGDFEGAGLEIAGAAVDFVPFVGQGASVSIDASLAVRDARMKEGVCAFGAVDANGKPITYKDENGQEMQAVGTEITYKNDKKEGPAKWYAFNEKGEPYLALIGAYKDDKQTGEWVRMDEQGNPVGRMHFEDGKPSGDLLYTDRKGNLIAKGNLTNGEYVEYYTDEQGNATEQVKQKGQFAKGYPAGKWDTYYPNGQQQTEFDYGKKTYKTYEMSMILDQPQKVKQEGTFIGDRVLKAYIPEKDPKAPQPSDESYKFTPEFGVGKDGTSTLGLDGRELRDTYFRYGDGIVNNTTYSISIPIEAVSEPASSVGLSNPASSGGISGRLSTVAPTAPRIPTADVTRTDQSGQTTLPQEKKAWDSGR